MTDAMDGWIKEMIRQEKEFLLYSLQDAKKNIARCTPLCGEIGDEYDAARNALTRLEQRLVAELVE